MKCIYKRQYDDLLKIFGYDKKKIVQEVEKYLGKRLLKPELNPQVTQHIQPTPANKELTPMTAESAADFFAELGATSQSSKQSNQLTNNNNEEQKLGEVS